MIRIFTIIVFLSFGLSSFSQRSAKALHKRGVYRYGEANDPTVVKRKGHRQVEYIPGMNKKMVFRIHWVSDHEYILTFVRHRNWPYYAKGDKMYAEIILYDAQSYTVKWTTVNSAYGETIMKKIK